MTSGEHSALLPCSCLLCGDELRLLVSSCPYQAVLIALFIPHPNPRYLPPSSADSAKQVLASSEARIGIRFDPKNPALGSDLEWNAGPESTGLLWGLCPVGKARPCSRRVPWATPAVRDWCGLSEDRNVGLSLVPLCPDPSWGPAGSRGANKCFSSGASTGGTIAVEAAGGGPDLGSQRSWGPLRNLGCSCGSSLIPGHLGVKGPAPAPPS